MNGSQLIADRLSRLARTLTACVGLLVGLLASLPCAAQMPQAPYAFPPRPNPYEESNIRVTYRGNIIMDLGNYDVVLGSSLPFGPPVPLGPEFSDDQSLDSDRIASTFPQIIYKGDSGLRWDGVNYLYHPAYPYDLVARYHYENRVVGREEEQYPPLLQNEWQVRGGQPSVTEETTETPLPFGQITPAPLPGSENLPEICRQFPFAIQCRPAWVQPPESVRIPGDLVPPDEMTVPQEPPAPRSPKTVPPPEPTLTIPEPQPIIILCPDDSSEGCAYELLSTLGDFAYTLAPGQKHVIRADRNWRIRFDSNGMGVQTYRLRSGRTYGFRKDQSGVWQFRWLRQPSPPSPPSPNLK